MARGTGDRIQRRGVKEMANRTDIPVGRSSAISRAALTQLWRCSDREARWLIAELRAKPSNDGCAILSTAAWPSGYWRSSDPHEITGFIRETEARARNTCLALRGAKNVLRQIDASGQMSFNDCLRDQGVREASTWRIDG